MLETLFWTSSLAALHHHVTYPLSLMALKPERRVPASVEESDLPRITLIVTAYQEARVIAAKIANIGALDYPADRLVLRVHCDGSTDGTPEAARKAVREHLPAGMDASVVDHPVNRGKVAVINEAVAACATPLVALSDASAMLPADALRRVAAHMADPAVGVAGGVYDCDANGSDGERRYWKVQNALRIREAHLGAPMGFSGAFYAFRREAFQPLEAGTINDDFILPMRVIAKGYRGVLDEGLAVTERERTRPGQEFARRMRIGAGNLQQAIRLASLANPARPGVAYAFLSGKGLRAVMPFLLATAFVTATLLGLQSTIWIPMAALAWLGLIYAAGGLAIAEERRSRLQAMAATVMAGYVANGIGALLWALGRFDLQARWGQAAQREAAHPLPASVRLAKRAFDIAGGLVLLLVLAVVLVPVALAIKLESRGPVFYRQLR
ncbi:MAG: glycosyltransferase, partial [Notoacmeibacter sp.]|nr:glycosyltransferase [Notoacmeibacter sp.]